MTDDIKITLAAWGAWTRDIGSGGSCSSPAQALINIAPFGEVAKRRARYDSVVYISDEDAIQIDRAMATLKRYSARLDVALGHMLDAELEDDNLMVCVLMYPVLEMHYRYDDSYRSIANELTRDLNKKITDVKVKAIVERGTGFIEGILIDAQCAIG